MTLERAGDDDDAHCASQDPGAQEAPRRWYLVYTKPRGEEIARENLERQGFETYLPRLRQPRRRRGSRVIRVEAMFPRYLFVHLNVVSDNWAPIRSTVGVTSLVQFGGRPAVVPDPLVEMLRVHDGEDGIQVPDVGQLRSGERVRLVDGPFAGYEGVFEAPSGKARVAVLLEIADRQTRVVLDAAHLDVGRSGRTPRG